MQKKTYTRYLLIFFIFLAFFFVLGDRLGLFVGIKGFFESISSPLRAKTYESSANITSLGTNQVIQQLREQNKDLQAQLAQKGEIEKENKALKDQFQVTQVNPQALLPATIVGAPGFLPGVSDIETLILDKGTKDGIKKGQSVIYKNNLVGTITSVSAHISVVAVTSSNQISFPAQTAQTQALGVLKGLGGSQMVLGNVVLSDTLKKNDLVVTKGNMDKNGLGIPSGIVVGKIVAINKKASNVFQSADVAGLLDFSRLSIVFIVL